MVGGKLANGPEIRFSRFNRALEAEDFSPHPLPCASPSLRRVLKNA